MVYFLTNVNTFLLGPPIFAVALVDLVLLAYLCPRRADRDIQREKPTSLQQLEGIEKDLVIDRADIARIVHKSGKRVIRVVSKSGETFEFVCLFGRKRREELWKVLGVFCLQDPVIHLES